MGPERAARARGRPRHQLHRAVGRAAQLRPQRRRSGSTAESGWRFRRRRALLGSGSGRGPARGAEVGQRPGGGCGDGRWRGVADDRDLRHARFRLLEQRARRQHPRHRRSLLRSLRNERQQVRRDRLDRSEVLRRAAREVGAQGRKAAASAGSLAMARDEGSPEDDLPHQDARRVVQDHGGQRHLLRARAQHG